MSSTGNLSKVSVYSLELAYSQPVKLVEEIEHLITIKLSMPIIGNLSVIFAADGFILIGNQEYY